jgi:hypothetical protein
MTIVRLPEPDQRIERLWQQYVEARLQAEETGNISDGIAAGKAWAAWLREFEPPQAQAVVVPFPRAARQ